MGSTAAELRAAAVNNSVALAFYGRLHRLAPALPLTRHPTLTSGIDIGGYLLLQAGAAAAGSDRDRRLATHLTALEARASQAGASLHVRYVPASDAELVAELLARGYHQTLEFPNCLLDLGWSNEEDYSRWLRQHHPATAKNIPYHRGLAHRAGISFRRLQGFAAHAPVLHQLFDQHHRRLNRTPLPFGPLLLSELEQAVGADNAVVFVAERQGQLLAANLLLQDGSVLRTLLAGMGDGVHRQHAVFEHLLFQLPIRHGLEHGFRTLHYGRLNYAMKRRRGCRLQPERWFLRGAHPLSHAALAPLVALRNLQMGRRCRRLGVHA